jgi:DNA-binding NarL/FixJ family response regulator
MRVLIVDDHAIFRGGVRNLIDDPPGSAVVGEASTLPEAVALAQDQEWDLVVLDITLGEASGLDALKQIKHVRPTLPVLILTMHPERQFARRSLKSGAAGYLTKDTSPTELRAAIRTVVGGGKYVSPSLVEALVADLEVDEPGQPHERLSDREFQVMVLIASGKTNGDIAELLSLSDRTISTYRARVLKKMGMRTNAELTHYAVLNKLTD